MFTFLSFLLVIMALYYLGVMADTYNADTTYLTPLIAFLIYVIICIIREGKRGSMSWLFGEDTYDEYGNRINQSSNQYVHYNTNSNNNSYNSCWNSQYNSRAFEKVEYYTPNKKEKTDDVKELVHYPSNREVREKIKELEKNRLWRLKRDAASVFGVDITEKYYKPTKVKENTVVKPIQKEDETKYMPRTSWVSEREKTEYNEVAGRVGRSFEIAITDTIILDDADNGKV